MEYKEYKINVFDLVICGPLDESLPGNNVLEFIQQNGIWGPQETKYLIHSLNKEDKSLVFVDVGSNSGYFTLIALKMGFNVIAIEANPIHKQYVMKSIELNNLDVSKLTYIEKFVSNNIEPTLFDGWSGIDNLMTMKDKTLVETISLDSLINSNVFLKIDVEGAEPQVFKSAMKSFKNNHIKYLMFEITYIIDNIIDEEQIEMLYFLHNNKYNIYDLIDHNNYFKINDIIQTKKKWEYEYFNIHKKHAPSIISAGTNIIAEKEIITM
jgi:FkbM family methyltransferase